ncbi:hypothetical protein CYMTET_35521, partial [Cymbomonas tetramitiformis]
DEGEILVLQRHELGLLYTDITVNSYGAATCHDGICTFRVDHFGVFTIGFRPFLSPSLPPPPPPPPPPPLPSPPPLTSADSDAAPHPPPGPPLAPGDAGGSGDDNTELWEQGSDFWYWVTIMLLATLLVGYAGVMLNSRREAQVVAPGTALPLPPSPKLDLEAGTVARAGSSGAAACERVRRYSPYGTPPCQLFVALFFSSRLPGGFSHRISASELRYITCTVVSTSR